MDDFMDQVIAQNLSGVGIEEITILYTEFYTNGTQKSYVFSDVQLKAGSTNVGNMTAKVTKSLEFQASKDTTIMANLKITLDSGKSLELRKPKFKDLERANTLSVDEAGNKNEISMAGALLKQLTLTVNDKVRAVERETLLDEILEFDEVMACLPVIQEFMGKPQTIQKEWVKAKLEANSVDL